MIILYSMRHLLPRDQGDTCCILSIDQDVINYDLKSFHCKVVATTFQELFVESIPSGICI